MTYNPHFMLPPLSNDPPLFSGCCRYRPLDALVHHGPLPWLEDISQDAPR